MHEGNVDSLTQNLGWILNHQKGRNFPL